LDFFEPALAGLVAFATSFSWWFPNHSIPFSSRLLSGALALANAVEKPG
jgi:hypothetical protein